MNSQEIKIIKFLCSDQTKFKICRKSMFKLKKGKVYLILYI